MTVEAIKEKRQLEKIKKEMKRDSNILALALFTCGINSALRISDLLSLTFEDIKGDRIYIKESKTKKGKQFPINANFKEAVEDLKLYYNRLGIKPIGYLFKATGNRARSLDKAISRQYAYEILNKYCAYAGIKGNIGTHTLRKTWAYHMYSLGYNIEKIQKALNHSSPKVTLAYIGIEQEEIDDMYISVNL